MTVLATVDGETVGVDEAFEFEGNSWISMSLYVTSGDEVEFNLFDPACAPCTTSTWTSRWRPRAKNLGTFNDPGDLPFMDDDAVMGCTDALACNYDDDANVDDGSCTYTEDGLDCDGNCLNDDDEDGICDGDEVDGCVLTRSRLRLRPDRDRRRRVLHLRRGWTMTATASARGRRWRRHLR